MVSKRTGIVTWGGLMCALALQWNCRAEYVEVEWIRPSGSNGDSAIILDYVPLATDCVETKVAMGNLTCDQALWCARGQSPADRTFTGYYLMDNHVFRFDRNASAGLKASVQVEKNRSYEIVADYANRTVTIGGEQEARLMGEGDFEVASKLCLFASHNDPEVGPATPFGNYSRGKLFYFRIKDAEGTLKLDLVPARDTEAEPGSVAEYGLYDRVAGRFYTNVKSLPFAHGYDLRDGLPRIENEILTADGVDAVSLTVAGSAATCGYRLTCGEISHEVFDTGETPAGETFVSALDTSALAEGIYVVTVLARNANGTAEVKVGQLAVGLKTDDAIWIGSADGDRKASTPQNWLNGKVPTKASKVIFDPEWSNVPCTFDAAWATAAGSCEVGALEIREGYEGLVVVATTIDNPPAGTACFPLFKVIGDVLLSGGRLGPQSHSTAQVERYRLRMQIGGNLTLEKKTAAYNHYGQITANERGRYSLTSPYRCYAPHGGDAGTVKKDVDTEYVSDRYAGYGSVFAPITPAIGSYYGTDSDDKKSRGGGAIEIEVAGDFVNDGMVDAVGNQTTAGAGPGGSIYIRAKNIRGAGTFRVRGQKATKTDNNAAASAGGRVALVAAETNEIAASQVQAEGAVAPRDGKEYLNAGAAGTIYLKGANVDQVLVKNTQATRSFVSTPIPAQADEAILFKPVDLCISDYGFAYLTQDVRCKSLTLGAATDRIDLNGKRLRVKELRVGGKKVKGGSYAIAPTSKLAIGGETFAGIMNTAAAEARLEIGCGMVVVVR